MAEGFSNPIVEAGVVGLRTMFAARAVTPVEATETYMWRIARLNPALGAVTDVDAPGARAGARASAARWTKGLPLSPIDGVPVLVKANIAITGLPWTAGIGAYRHRIAQVDAEVVARLRRAGAVILGSVNMHEGALGATTDNPWFGRTQNPHREGFTPGGSSGGSGAAAAAGLCAAALGTDTMGSVRIPSAYCGIFGHKPGYGAVSDAGATALSWTLDHIGPHARSAADCAAMLHEIADVAKDAAVEGVVGVLAFEGQVEVAPEVADAFADTLARARTLGLKIEIVRLSDYDFGRMRRLGLLVSEAEGFVVHQAMLADHPEGFSETFRGMLDWGGRQPAHKLANAYREIALAGSAVRAIFAPYAAILMPTAPQTAFAFGDAPANQADFTAIANFTGLPATAFPVGMTSAGLPLSCQVIARNEATALGLAERLAVSVGAPAGYRG
jgi:aspartyl-tRNA(Asn)/glutamyl-tRNA(Gln) amidotransferase subunit A